LEQDLSAPPADDADSRGRLVDAGVILFDPIFQGARFPS
jgi:hypothetical protein